MHGPALTRASAETPATWPRSAQIVAVTLTILALILLAGRLAGQFRGGARPTELVFRTDLNQADATQLRQLPGIGPSLAQRIEAYRATHGAFQSVEELRQVSGIGPATVERVRPYLWLEAPLPDDDSPSPEPVRLTRKPTLTPAPESKAGRKIEQLAEPIDLNRADAATLRQLPGIGPVLSERIVRVRQERPFDSIEELRRVPGIGPKTLERLRPFIRVTSPESVPAQ